MPVLTPRELWEATGRDSIPEVFRLRGSHWAQIRPPDDARGDGDVSRARDPELPAAAADALPLLDQGTRRAAAARRASPRARVHHEGRVLVRPRRGRARRELSQAGGCVPPDLPAVRARVLGRGRRSPGSWAGRSRSTSSRRRDRERTRSSRARTATTRRTSRSPAAFPGPPSSPSAGTRRRRSGPQGSRRSKPSPSSSGIDASATSKAMPVVKTDGTLVLGLVRGDDRLSESKMLGVLGSDFRPATDEEIRDGVRRQRWLARPDRRRRRGRRRRRPSRRAVRRRREPRRPALARRGGGPRLRTAFRGHPRARRGRHVPRVRRCAPLSDRDRGRAHLQVRHAVRRAARGDVPRRGRGREAV